MDRHHAAHRAAGRLRCRRAALPCRARGRRQLSHQGDENLHHLWRSRHDRQHRAFRAGTTAGCTRGHQRHFAVFDSEIHGQRRQGRAVGKTGDGADPIIVHPDIKRMLMQMRALTAAARTICYATAVALDVSIRAKDPKVQADAAARGALLTPIAKAFSTDIGNEVAYLGVQIHGGMGFIEETGAAQYYRDARITPIYEGTNGIQAIDLVTRKLAANGGAAVWALLDELSAIVSRVEASNDPAFGTTGAKLRDALGSLERTSKWLLERVGSAPNEALAGATPYLQQFGATLGGCMLASEALAAKAEANADAARYVSLARFFAENITVQAGALERTVTESADSVAAADAVLL